MRCFAELNEAGDRIDVQRVRRIMRLAVRSGSCLEWRARADGRTAQIKIGPGKLVYVHRAVWAMYNGPIPDGLNVLHRCDNPPCIEPTHLFLGTQVSNIIDMVTKGRSWYAPGAPRACLSEGEVIDIRLRYRHGETQKFLAKSFGISQPTVSEIVNHRTWKNVS